MRVTSTETINGFQNSPRVFVKRRKKENVSLRADEIRSIQYNYFFTARMATGINHADDTTPIMQYENNVLMNVFAVEILQIFHPLGRV
jgi:hypothetical protein